eukprot:CAMPEP_0119102568 /NCGR_PEP_ID=MMETSP1180-20130426/1276_1 /TAXON_ID=3052 ORGANISM="Chlamydomonas cf sp, Strain CCMP681" /NCGR_SAMPLE_ID=MMETSP1180 /ASSEMBLY_ACC=CAM_ASM_000741 /LENGTH=193 /DNA_ID=CAMNT_0007086879 /DNA_START=210 /DNA_END=792 /DNA_ORIENTATION=+
MRVEPKSYFALERTFLSWIGMAVTMGGVSSVLVGFNNSEATTHEEQLISKRTIDVITCIYTPIAMLIMAYGLFTYEWRSHFLRKKQLGLFDDKFGPTTIAILVLLTLIIIFVLALYDYMYDSRYEKVPQGRIIVWAVLDQVVLDAGHTCTAERLRHEVAEKGVALANMKGQHWNGQDQVDMLSDVGPCAGHTL